MSGHICHADVSRGLEYELWQSDCYSSVSLVSSSSAKEVELVSDNVPTPSLYSSRQLLSEMKQKTCLSVPQGLAASQASPIPVSSLSLKKNWLAIMAFNGE